MIVAVVGATGLVGSKMLEVLEERGFPVSELLPVKGVTFIGELPDKVQYTTRFAGAVVRQSAQPDEAAKLLHWLASPEAQQAVHDSGLHSVKATTPVKDADTVQ